MSLNAFSAADHVQRRRCRNGGLLAVGLLLSSSCATAKWESWRCVAPVGRFEKHDVAVSEAATQFSGTMVIHKADGLGAWRPTARVAFTDADLASPECHCSGVVASWYRDKPDFFLVSLSADGEKIPLGYVPVDKPVTFKLTYAQGGALRLEVGSGVAIGRSSLPVRNNLQMSCSTAAVDFDVTVVPATEEKSAERCPFAAQEQWPAADVERYCRPRQ